MFVKVVPQGYCVIVKRFGKPVRVVQSGLHFFIPVLESLQNVRDKWGAETCDDKGEAIELSEQILDTKPRDCFTKDNVKLSADCVFRWRVTDPLKAYYEVDHLHKSLCEIVLNEMRSLIGSRDLNDVLSSRSLISESIVMAISATARRWGVNIISAEIQQLEADSATLDAMRRQLEAARESEAMKLEAAGKAEAMIRVAEAEREAARIRAEGEADAIRTVAEGEAEYVKSLSAQVGVTDAAKLLLAEKTLKAYEKITGNAANKVFIPMGANAPTVMVDVDK